MKNFVKILIFVFLLFRVFLSLKLQLHPDEAYYWLWSKHLDLSYFDHSPMVAYFIRFTTLFSDKEFFVRFSTILSYIIFNFVCLKFVKKFFGEETAWLSLLIFNVFPANALGFIITPDIPLMLFTVLFLYFLFCALESKKFVYWIFAGVSCGMSMLSKYNGVLSVVSMFCIILFVKEYRDNIFKVYPYSAVFISGLIFLPVIIWNYLNNWISFKYQFFHGLPQKSGNFNNILTYLGGQVGSLGIVLGLICFYVLVYSLFVKNRILKSLAMFGFIPITFFGITSYKNLAEINWPICGYPAIAVVVASYFSQKMKLKKFLLFPSVVFCLVLILTVYLHGIFRLIPLEKINSTWVLTDPTNWFYGWEEFVKFLKQKKLEYPVVTTNHQLISELIFYSKGTIDVFYNEKQFNIWNKNKSLPKKFYFINYESDVKTPLPQDKGFNGKFVLSYDVYRKNFRIRTYNIFFCEKNEYTTF